MAKKKKRAKPAPRRARPQEVKPKTEIKVPPLVAKILQKWPYILSVFMTILFYLIFQGPANLDDSCFIGGDTWEYHGMGVNLAYGHGPNKFGAFEPWETYKFTWGDDRKAQNFQKTKRNNFLRTPGYGFFLGAVYKIFGVDVSAVKHIQLWMIAFIAGFIPLLGWRLASKTGYFAGLVSSPFIMLSSYEMSELLMTEAITALAVFAILFAIERAFRKTDVLSGVLLGLALGVGLLIKGALIFIPIILTGIFIIQAIKNRSRKSLMMTAAMYAGMTVLVLPWSWYASSQANKKIFLSTQSETLILDCNNSLSQDGVWHPEWRQDKRNPELYYHNQARLKDKSSVAKVISYYSDYPQFIYPTFTNKVIRAFGRFPYLWLVFYGLCIQLLVTLLRKNRKLLLPVSLAGLIGFGIAANLLFQNHLHRFVEDGNIYGSPVVPDNLALIGVLLMVVAAFISAFRKDNQFLGLSSIFYIILGNFVLLILLFWGSVRFVKVVDFVFVFFAFMLPAHWLAHAIKQNRMGKNLLDRIRIPL